MKKVPFSSNPLYNFERFTLLNLYEEIENEEELCTFYHHALSVFEDNPTLTKVIYAMIAYSTGIETNSINILL